MKNKYHGIFNIAVLIVGMGGYQMAFAAKPLTVTSAFPAEAQQGQTLYVTVGGSGFDATVNEVNFLVPCDTDTCDPENTGGVTTDDITVINSKELKVRVMINKDATAVLRDIEVKSSRGRGGKGTTLFKVQQSQELQFTPVGIDVEFQDSLGNTLEKANPWNGPYPNVTTGEARHPWTSQNWSWATGGAFFFDNWDANDLAVVPRPCLYTTVGALPPTGGRYDCFEGGGETWPHGGRMSIDLSDLVWVEAEPPRKGWRNPELCNLVNEPESWAEFDVGSQAYYLRFGVTRYQIYFMDGCDSYACNISMRAMSYSGTFTGQPDTQLVQLHPFHDLPGFPDIGKLSVSAWVRDGFTARDLGPTAGNELNVFSVEQDIPIARLSIQFASVKNGSTVATCEAAVGRGELWLVARPE